MSQLMPANMGTDIMRFARLEMAEVEEFHVEGFARTVDHLRGPNGAVRAGALMTMLDSAGGVCGGLASLPDGWVVTTNMFARRVSLEPTGPLKIDARILRKGRNSVVAAVEIGDAASGQLVLDGELTSAILVPEDGPPVWERPMRMVPPDDFVPMPIDEWAGASVVDATTLEMPMRDALRNPWGILHGGVTAALVDLTAVHATGGVCTDMVLHYLAPNRVGPVTAHAEVQGVRADGTVLRVEVRDLGADRVTAVAIATAAV
jgi:uncharacterized protein (TIGR00369 family)